MPNSALSLRLWMAVSEPARRVGLQRSSLITPRLCGPGARSATSCERSGSFISTISARGPSTRAESQTGVVATSLAGIRTIIVVPMLKDDDLIGALSVYRTEVRPFSDRQIALLTAFTQQAVIAIENTRLFEAEQASKRELTEALEQQTATSEILGVISRSPTDVQPVFDAIADSAMRLCNADYGSTVRLEDGLVHLIARRGHSSLWLEESRRLFPHPLTRDLIGGAAMLDRQIVHLEDIQSDPRFATSHAIARTWGYHTAL